MVFPVVKYGCDSWTINKAEHRRIDAFELWCWRRLLRVTWSPLDCKEIQPVPLKEICPEYSLEGLMLKLKLQYFGHLMWRTDSFEKTLILGKIEGRRRGDNRGWDGWMASPTQWTWVWVSSACWWWTGRPGVLQSMGSQRVGHDWATEQTVIGLFRVLFLLESVLVICVFLGICPFHLNCLIYWYTADHSISFYFCRVSNDSSFIPNFSNESSLFVSWPVWHISVLFIFSKNFLFC